MRIRSPMKSAASNDLAWAISVGGIGVVGCATLLLFTWYYSATLFLIFAGMLLGVALNALTTMLGRVVKLPHALRLTVVCLVLALSLIHISEPTRRTPISYAVFCLKK